MSTTSRSRAEHGAGHVCQSVEFRRAGRSDFQQRGQYAVSTRDGTSLSEIGRLRQSADGDRWKRRREYPVLPHLDLLQSRLRPARANRLSGVSGAPTTAQKDSNGQLVFEDQGTLLLWVAGVPTTASQTFRQPARPPTLATRSPISPTGPRASPISPRALFPPRSTSAPATAPSRSTASTERTTPARPTGYLHASRSNGTLPGNVGGRSAALAGSFFQGGPTNSTPLYGEMGGSLNLTGTGGYLGSGIFAARKP